MRIATKKSNIIAKIVVVRYHNLANINKATASAETMESNVVTANAETTTSVAATTTATTITKTTMAMGSKNKMKMEITTNNVAVTNNAAIIITNA